MIVKRLFSYAALPGVMLAALFFSFPGLDAKAAGPVNVDSIRSIYVLRPLSSVDEQSISLLIEGMRKIYGINLVTKSDPSQIAIGADGIILGAGAALAAGMATQGDLAAIGPEGHIFQSGNNRIIIAGKKSWDTYFGVVTFLESLGARFFDAGLTGASWPKPGSRQIPAVAKTAIKPSFVFRPGWEQLMRLNTCEHGDPRKGANLEVFDPKLTGSDLWIDHTAGYLVPKLLYYDRHREYYAELDDGSRIANSAFSDQRTPLCLSNPGVVKISKERALQWVGDEPEKKFFNITYGDTQTWCRCKSCVVMDPVPGHYADRLLRWVNPIAQAIRLKFPDVIVRTFAYNGSQDPPTGIAPESNVWIMLAVDLAGVPFWDHAIKTSEPIVAKNIARLNGWRSIAPNRVAVCEYHDGMYYPAPLQTLQSRLAYYTANQVQGIAYTYGTPKNFSPVFNYVFSKLMWDAATSAGTAAAEVIKHHYGPAAPAVSAYLDLCGRRYQETLDTTVSLRNLYPPDFYSDAFVQKALALLDQARKAVAFATTLGPEMTNEESLFMNDLMSHLPDQVSDNKVLSYCERIRSLALERNQRAGFPNRMTTIVRNLEARPDGARFRSLIGNWLSASPEMQPEVVSGGLRFTADKLLWGDAGPADVPSASGYWWSGKIVSPMRQALIVFPNANDSRGIPTTALTEARFNLSSPVRGSGGTVMIEAQDAMWAGVDAEDKRSAMRAKMVLSVNDTEIFAGDSGFPRGDWGTRTFIIPPGVLKDGKNEIRLANRSGYDYWPTTNWLCVSQLTVVVDKYLHQPAANLHLNK